MAKLNLDLSDVQPDTGGGTTVPQGDYVVAITEAFMKATSAGTGHFLQVEMQITEGEMKGASITDRFNLDNPNAKAVEIAKAQLKAVTEAIGHVGVLEDSDDLIGKPFKVRVLHRFSAQYGTQPEVNKRGAVSEDFGPLIPTEPPVAGAAPAASGGGSAGGAAAPAGDFPWNK